MGNISELLPMPDVAHSRLVDFIPLSIAGLHKATALEPDDRHLLMDNLISGAVGEQMEHPAQPSAGYVITWNKIIGAIQKKIDSINDTRALLSSKGKEGAARRWNREQSTEGQNGGHGEAIGGPWGGHGEAMGGPWGEMANQDSDIDREYENEFNKERATKLNSIHSQPHSVQEVLSFANSPKNHWNVTQDEAKQWFKMNDDNQWIDYKTKQPISNWQGLLKRWLLAERRKEHDKIWADREERLREKATDYGIDAELDRQWYDAMKKLAALRPRNYESLQEDIRAYEDHYAAKQRGADGYGQQGRKDK